MRACRKWGRVGLEVAMYWRGGGGCSDTVEPGGAAASSGGVSRC